MISETEEGTFADRCRPGHVAHLAVIAALPDGRERVVCARCGAIGSVLRRGREDAPEVLRK